MFFIKTYLKHKKYKNFIKAVNDLKLTENMNFEALADFYGNLYNIINEYQDIFIDLPKQLKYKQKVQIISHLKDLTIDYVDIIKNLNMTLSAVLRNKELSFDVRKETANFAEKSIAISETTINIIQKLANIID